MNRLKIKLESIDLSDILDHIDHTVCNGCPFNFITEEHDYIQNMGCLPDAKMIMEEYLNNNGHWKCHSCDKPCAGLQKALDTYGIKAENNQLLVTGDNPIIKK